MDHDEIPDDLGCTRAFPDRAAVTLTCAARQGTRAWQRVALVDISPTGFRIARLAKASTDLPVRIRIPGLQVLTAQICWQQGESVGCAFGAPLHVAVFEHIVAQARAAAGA